MDNTKECEATMHQKTVSPSMKELRKMHSQLAKLAYMAIYSMSWFNDIYTIYLFSVGKGDQEKVSYSNGCISRVKQRNSTHIKKY